MKPRQAQYNTEACQNGIEFGFWKVEIHCNKQYLPRIYFSRSLHAAESFTKRLTVVRKSSHNLTSLLFFLESSCNIPDPVAQNSSPGSQHRMWSGPPSSLVMSSELKLPFQHVNLTHSFCKTLTE